MLFPEVRMGEVDTMLDKAISAFKGSIVLFFEQLGESFSTGGMKDMAYDRYQCWLQKHILPRHKWKPSIILPDMPVSSRPCLDARGGNLTNTTRTNTCLASLTAIPNCSSSSSPSSSGSEMMLYMVPEMSSGLLAIVAQALSLDSNDMLKKPGKYFKLEVSQHSDQQPNYHQPAFVRALDMPPQAHCHHNIPPDANGSSTQEAILLQNPAPNPIARTQRQ
ncbi:hypothetical protein F5141DRAFT_1061917 [Pisolithus sp. B1]|nr:hypothetical protein F5141DRAFT_1061917 [Pisolithus sp. B1]